MARRIDLPLLRRRSIAAIQHSMERIDSVRAGGADYLLVRWMAAMSAVELHGIWERYVESRLAAALNHDAAHFLDENGVKGVKQVSSGLAAYIVRNGGRYFDFRSMSDLLRKADLILSRANNPFRILSTDERSYIDALAAIRNCVVHGSDEAQASYRRKLRDVYGIRSAPGAEEFLNATDYRQSSRSRYQPRLNGLAIVLSEAIHKT